LTIGKRYCGVTYETIEPIVTNLQQKVAELAEVFSLQLPAGQSYVDLLLAAQSRLADETINVAAAMAAPEDELFHLTSQLREDLAAVTQTGGRRNHSHSPAPTTHPLPTHHAITHPTAALACATTARQQAAIADHNLASMVSAAVQRCRQARQPLTLAVFEIDGFSDLLLQASPMGTTEIAHALCCALADWTNQPDEAIQISDNRVAMIWDRCSRSEAVRRSRECLAAVRPWSRDHWGVSCEFTLSIGLATLETAPKNYPPQELIDAAHRCLSGAGLSGGDTVKSIAF
jgi:hypothetical protein